MKVYKVYNNQTESWYRGNGLWSLKEDLGKVYKKRNHASSAMTLHLGLPSKYDIKRNPKELERLKLRSEKYKGIIEIVTFEVKEIKRDYLL